MRKFLTFIPHCIKTGNVKSRMPLPKRSFACAVAGAIALLAAFSNLHAQDVAPSPSPAATPPPLEPPPSNVIVAPASTGSKPPTVPEPTPAVATHADAANGPKFIGAQGCSSSLCHGGGSAERNAYTVWKGLDRHSRAFATLATARATQIAQGLALPAPAQTRRCTECHAPTQTIPEERLMAGAKPEDGISCENCHGAAQDWIRSHTRRDFTHAQNVQTGVREMRGLYARANACVACHQVLKPDILAAGHPPLLFELDAQTVAEPRHWTIDKGDYFGPKAWLTGQAVALRETSWSLSQAAEPLPEVQEQWGALVWLLQRTADAYGDPLPKFDVPEATDYSPGNVARAQTVADDMAKAAAGLDWSRASTRRCLAALAGTHGEFVPVSGGPTAGVTQHRAQRLALALSRLLAPLQANDAKEWAPASAELDKLFALADARMAFDGGKFAAQLETFSKALASAGEGTEKVAAR